MPTPKITRRLDVELSESKSILDEPIKNELKITEITRLNINNIKYI